MSDRSRAPGYTWTVLTTYSVDIVLQNIIGIYIKASREFQAFNFDDLFI